MDIGLLVSGIDLGTLFVDRRKKGGQQLELKTLCNAMKTTMFNHQSSFFSPQKTMILTGEVVLELNLAVEMVGSSPGFGESDALDLIRVLGLEITNNDAALVVTLTIDLESLLYI